MPDRTRHERFPAIRWVLAGVLCFSCNTAKTPEGEQAAAGAPPAPLESVLPELTLIHADDVSIRVIGASFFGSLGSMSGKRMSIQAGTRSPGEHRAPLLIPLRDDSDVSAGVALHEQYSTARPAVGIVDSRTGQLEVLRSSDDDVMAEASGWFAGSIAVIGEDGADRNPPAWNCIIGDPGRGPGHVLSMRLDAVGRELSHPVEIHSGTKHGDATGYSLSLGRDASGRTLLWIGSPGFHVDSSGPGRIDCLSLDQRQLLHTTAGPAGFGRMIEVCGDVDGDGVDDALCGIEQRGWSRTPGESTSELAWIGRVQFLSGRSGAVLWEWSGEEVGAVACAAVSTDSDSDSVPDLLFGLWPNRTASAGDGQGYVAVVSSRTGAVLRRMELPLAPAEHPTSLSAAWLSGPVSRELLLVGFRDAPIDKRGFVVVDRLTGQRLARVEATGLMDLGEDLRSAWSPEVGCCEVYALTWSGEFLRSGRGGPCCLIRFALSATAG